MAESASRRRDPSCVFCDIVARTKPASVVYEDHESLVLMDLVQEVPGHALVIPRIHYEGLADLPPATGAHLFQVGQRVAAALKRSGLRCEGVQLALADGEAAGQDVFHVHLHVLARYVGDPPGKVLREILRPNWQKPEVRPPREELDRLAAQIGAAFV